MSVRDLKYPTDLSNEELKEMLQSIKSDEHIQDLYLKSCRLSKPEIANYLYDSLTIGISWDDYYNVSRQVPIPKTDFYGYRRKALIELRKMVEREKRELRKKKKDKKENSNILEGQLTTDDLGI